MDKSPPANAGLEHWFSHAVGQLKRVPELLSPRPGAKSQQLRPCGRLLEAARPGACAL